MGTTFDYFSNIFTVDVYCDVEVIQEPTFVTSKADFETVGGSSFQMFIFPYFTSVNSLCAIASYQISSDPNSVISIADLFLEDTGAEYKVKREITDGNVYDYTFYLHVTPTDEKNNIAKSFGPYTLLAISYC